MKTKRAKALKPVKRYYCANDTCLIGSSRRRLSPTDIETIELPLTPASKRKMVEVMAKAHCEAISGEPIPDWYFRITKNRFKKVLDAIEAIASPTE